MDEIERSPLPVPDVTPLDCAFGNIKHLPQIDALPESFRRWHGTPWHDIVEEWFFKGLDASKLTPKPGVDKGKALAALKAAMVSFEPSHERKVWGVAYLMSEWFVPPESKHAGGAK